MIANKIVINTKSKVNRNPINDIFGIKVDLPKVKATALTDIKDPIEITVKLDGEVYIGESKVEVENLIPRLNAITEQNTEARIYIRGDRVVAYGRIMEIMSIINSAGYIKVALITQNLEQ